jgi:ribulose-5-phosphate 4-epimerase/fuculose-1-phosphate aldolase
MPSLNLDTGHPKSGSPAASAADLLPGEWQARCEMAALFRWMNRLGMNEQIANHCSLMLPGSDHLFIINPRGLHYREITASKLIVCDLEGNVLRGGGELRKVAFYIHTRIHLRHPQARCVLHVHPQYLTALSMVKNGRLELVHQNSASLYDRVAYDEVHNGVVLWTEEGDRMADLMADKTILLSKNHGVTVVGPTPAEAFDELYIAERTAMYQVTAMSTGLPLAPFADNLRDRFNGPWGEKFDADLHLAAVRRMLDLEEPDYAT